MSKWRDRTRFRASQRKVPSHTYVVHGRPISLGIDALKEELDAVTSMIQHEDGWHLYQGDDLLAVISHGKLTNRALVATINRR